MQQYDNLDIKRNNKYDKNYKLSKNNVDILNAILYNKDTLKNSHLIEQMAHHRLSPVTHNMYEGFIGTDFTHGAQETEIRGTSS